MRRLRHILVLTTFAAALAACAALPTTPVGVATTTGDATPPALTATLPAARPPAADSSATSPPASPTVSTGSPTPPAALPTDLLALPEVAQAQADLAQRLSISPDDISVVEVLPQTWTDTSMGCPQPGMDYLQVLVEGLLVRLDYAGQVYAYHSGGGQPPFLCQAPAPGEKPVP